MNYQRQGGENDYAFHTLGWYQFQILCQTVLMDILGQTVEVYSPGNDAGRDAAFSGRWHTTGSETLSGTFTFQIKYSRYRSQPLTYTSLKPEIEKAKTLVNRGLANNYILVTSYGLTASSAAELASVIKRDIGCREVRIYGPD